MVRLLRSLFLYEVTEGFLDLTETHQYLHNYDQVNQLAER